MMRFAQFAVAGVLAVASLATMAWSAAPRHFAEPPAVPVLSELPPPPSRGTAPTATFAGKLPITELNEQEAVLHALNRLGYGPRPGEIEQIENEGLEKWIQAQLHPEAINDSAAEMRLAKYSAWNSSATQLLADYPQPQAGAKELGLSLPDYQKRLQDMAKQSRELQSAPYDQQQIVTEMMETKLLRAVYSERQLSEQLADFWFNHFNVFIYKDLDRWYLILYERDAIRPHVLGKFRDLLDATAKSPAMLFYLDNYISADPNAFQRLKQHPPRTRPGVKLPPLGGKRGLNENYGRELMELHTLGVDGGYTQQDVIEVARAFTGWTIAAPRDHPEFYFDARLHDPDAKRVLGKKIHAGGIKDGEQVLDLLAKDRHTAQHTSFELARHFVSDDPPPALVQRMAATFQKSKGDIRAVMNTMIYSPEFWSRAAFRAKVKTPFELVVSATRALGADVNRPLPTVQWVGRIGEPLYQCLTPDGYSDKAGTWVSTGALLNRMNFAITLAGNHVQGATVQIDPVVGPYVGSNAQAALDRAIAEFLGGQVSDSTRATLDRATADPQVLGARLDDPVRKINMGLISGMVLGSPEFQRR